jgi:predicted DNA-binding transcriptional regulator AlpA
LLKIMKSGQYPLPGAVQAAQFLGPHHMQPFFHPLMATGDFPKAFKLGMHRNSHPMWWRYEIIEWLQTHASRKANMQTP